MERNGIGDRIRTERRVADGWALVAVLGGAGAGLALGIGPWSGSHAEADPTVVIVRSAPAADPAAEATAAATPDRLGSSAAEFGLPPRSRSDGVLVVDREAVAGVPFAVSSLGTGFSVRGRYAGSVSWTPDGTGLRVAVESGRISTRIGTVGGDHLEGIRVGLARKTERGWSMLRSSRLHHLDHPLQEAESLAVRPFELVIPGVGEEDLADSWLVVTHELTVTPDESGGSAGPAWTYVHGEPGVLMNLLHGC